MDYLVGGIEGGQGKEKKKSRKQEKRGRKKAKTSTKCVVTVLKVFAIYFSPEVALIDTLASYLPCYVPI